MHALTPTFPPRAALSFSRVAAATFALSVASGAAPADPFQAGLAAIENEPPEITRISELRARGPAALEELLARWDREMLTNAGPSENLEALIDAVAGQRYATFSRLYWYTDLERARLAAHQLHRPILALRMLGDLRDDLSCANSRLFRATLYANTAVSAFLRAHFVLYWSSERPVPTVTIDFGDGRKLVRTTTGNSAHYVLDEDGHVLDVLPGLYAPQVFQRELAASLALAAKVRGMTTEQRIRVTVGYHAAALDATDRAWQRVRQAPYVRGKQFLLAAGELDSAIARAQRATVSKMLIEVPDLRAIGLVQPGDVPGDAAAWSAIGQAVWKIAGPAPAPGASRVQADLTRPRPTHTPEPVPPPMVLDVASRALVARLHNAGPGDQDATPAELARVIARLEQHIVADTALDQFTLRQQIHRRIVDRAETDFETLNAWIYDEVFSTPRSDPWLGLRARTDFTGLPGDGVVMR